MSAETLHLQSLLARTRVLVPSTRRADSAAAIDHALACIGRIQQLCPDDPEVTALAQDIRRIQFLMQCSSATPQYARWQHAQ